MFRLRPLTILFQALRPGSSLGICQSPRRLSLVLGQPCLLYKERVCSSNEDCQSIARVGLDPSEAPCPNPSSGIKEFDRRSCVLSALTFAPYLNKHLTRYQVNLGVMGDELRYYNRRGAMLEEQTQCTQQLHDIFPRNDSVNELRVFDVKRKGPSNEIQRKSSVSTTTACS